MPFHLKPQPRDPWNTLKRCMLLTNTSAGAWDDVSRIIFHRARLQTVQDFQIPSPCKKTIKQESQESALSDLAGHPFHKIMFVQDKKYIHSCWQDLHGVVPQGQVLAGGLCAGGNHGSCVLAARLAVSLAVSLRCRFEVRMQKGSESDWAVAVGFAFLHNPGHPVTASQAYPEDAGEPHADRVP